MSKRILARLVYVLLLVCALFAIVVGLVPTALTLTAVFALPVTVLAVVGLISPNAIAARPWARRTVTVALILLGSEFVFVSSNLLVSRRRPLELVITGDQPRLVRVVYGVADGDRQPWRWERRIVVPTSNIAFVQYRNNGTWYSSGNPHPIRVTTTRKDGTRQSGFGSWVEGGYTEGGACHFEYDEYAVGNRPNVKATPDAEPWRTGWLDSLSRWGVECHRGKLVRSNSASVANVRRTGSACYLMPEGGVACSSAPLSKRY